MIEQVVIECEDGNIVLEVDYDKIGKGADLGKLDEDLVLIKYGQLDVKLPEDTYDYDAHQWETDLGKKIGAVFAEVEAEEKLCLFHRESCCMKCWNEKETVL